MTTVVETRNLTKRYGHLTAVEDLNLQVHQGEVYGFLGPNGSGKTTTILMLLGLTEPTSGWARVGGLDPLREPLKVKRLVSYLPENVGFYNDLTARQNLRYIGELNGIPRQEASHRIERLLEQVGLAEDAARPVGQFSRGMRQRLGIADALLKQPRLVFLDDPTIGLDPEGIRELLEMVASMSRDHGITVFLSSHLLHQVQRICHRMGILFRGRMVAEGTLAELDQGGGQGGLRIELQVGQCTPALVAALQHLPGVRQVTAVDDRIALDCAQDVRAQVPQTVLEHGGQLLQLRSVERTLEEIYLRYFHEAELAARV